MPFRQHTAQPEGGWARFLQSERKKRGWSQTEGFRRVRAQMGWSENSRASYVAIDSGKRQPKEDEEAVLREVFGGGPELAPEPTPDQEPGLAAAIRELAAELRAARQERAEWQERVLAVEAAVALLTQRSGARRSGSAAPRGLAE